MESRRFIVVRGMSLYLYFHYESLTKTSMKKHVILLIQYAAIIVISFFLYSSLFYPLLNSDDAVSILMLHNFRLPEDLFFWGQDRVGSVIPLLGQIPYKLLGINHLWSESLIHYLILIAGFSAFSTFLNSKTSKIIFAVLWFLPIDAFLGLTRYSFGIQYSFVGIGLYFIKFVYESKSLKTFRRYAFWSLAFLSFLTAVYSTESAVVTIAIILAVLAFYSFREKEKFRIEGIVFTSVSVILGIFVMYLLKNAATVSQYYEYNRQLLNTPAEFIDAVSILFNKVISSFSIDNHNPFIFIYAWLCLIQLISVPIIVFSGKTGKIKAWQWFLIFILDGMTFLFINTVSHWSLLNGVARRYFVGVYIMLWLSYLICSDHIINKKLRTIIQVIALATVLTGAVSIPYGYKYVFPKRLTSKAKVVSEFKQLGKIGIISEYWNSYGTSFVDPDNIKATPHDGYEIRNHELVDSVLSQKRVFLIKDLWLDSFPDKISQFGNQFEKVGNEQHIGDCYVCEYQLSRIDTVLNINNLSINEKLTGNYEDITILARKDDADIIYKHIVSGPYLTLNPGEYTVNFHLMSGPGEINKSVGIMDIVSDYGKNTIASKKIDPGINSLNESLEKTTLSFSLEQKTENVEFRIYYYGEADLTFSHIAIKQVKSTPCLSSPQVAQRP